MRFRIADLESRHKDENVVKAVRNSDLLFIDGGDKILEALFFARFIRPGGGLLIHDVEYRKGRWVVGMGKVGFGLGPVVSMGRVGFGLGHWLNFNRTKII